MGAELTNDFAFNLGNKPQPRVISLARASTFSKSSTKPSWFGTRKSSGNNST